MERKYVAIRVEEGGDCDCCGRTDLKKVVVLRDKSNLDIKAGRICASKMLKCSDSQIKMIWDKVEEEQRKEDDNRKWIESWEGYDNQMDASWKVNNYERTYDFVWLFRENKWLRVPQFAVDTINILTSVGWVLKSFVKVSK